MEPHKVTCLILQNFYVTKPGTKLKTDFAFGFLAPSYGHHNKHYLNGFECQQVTGDVVYIN